MSDETQGQAEPPKPPPAEAPTNHGTAQPEVTRPGGRPVTPFTY